VLALAGQLVPTTVGVTQTAATPIKSAKSSAQVQSKAGDNTNKPAATASDTAVATKAAPAAPSDDAPPAPAFTLPHDDSVGGQDPQTDPSQGQPSPDASATNAQIAPQAAAPNVATSVASAANAAANLASGHGAAITAQLAAQITSKAGAARAAFGFALEPQGLGRVDVSLKFDAQGQLSAVLSFDNPSAAAEAKGRAADLQQALQQAGVDISQSGLSFTSGGGQGQGAAWQGNGQSSYAQPSGALDTAPIAATANVIHSALGASRAGGLDITI